MNRSRENVIPISDPDIVVFTEPCGLSTESPSRQHLLTGQRHVSVVLSLADLHRWLLSARAHPHALYRQPRRHRVNRAPARANQRASCNRAVNGNERGPPAYRAYKPLHFSLPSAVATSPPPQVRQVESHYCSSGAAPGTSRLGGKTRNPCRRP